ncbi:hypothetical protein [Aminicella lysinilytica]|uniref:Uncharacterized protein n=1 Tax=Aminicella lysinilytica TaxID=433323 RepID=A0A4R6PYB2_9FIRM|nr:hypothetical protein [Aminicella lysinilytica]TDP46646.1 hypothetical protein EV211_1571 [Aminicella lysinilytica]
MDKDVRKLLKAIALSQFAIIIMILILVFYFDVGRFSWLVAMFTLSCCCLFGSCSMIRRKR